MFSRQYNPKHRLPELKTQYRSSGCIGEVTGLHGSDLPQRRLGLATPYCSCEGDFATEIGPRDSSEVQMDRRGHNGNLVGVAGFSGETTASRRLQASYFQTGTVPNVGK